MTFRTSDAVSTCQLVGAFRAANIFSDHPNDLKKSRENLDELANGTGAITIQYENGKTATVSGSVAKNIRNQARQYANNFANARYMGKDNNLAFNAADVQEITKQSGRGDIASGRDLETMPFQRLVHAIFEQTVDEEFDHRRNESVVNDRNLQISIREDFARTNKKQQLEEQLRHTYDRKVRRELQYPSSFETPLFEQQLFIEALKIPLKLNQIDPNSDALSQVAEQVLRHYE